MFDGFWCQTEESTSKTLEKPLPIWGITIPWWKYTARALAYRIKSAAFGLIIAVSPAC